MAVPGNNAAQATASEAQRALELLAEAQQFCRHLEADQTRLLATGHWVGGWQLGRGGSGMAGLWCRDDGHGNIADRAVLKLVCPDAAHWTDPGQWIHGERLEIAMHHGLSSASALGDYIVGYRGSHVDLTAQEYSIYMEFCPFGTLDDILRTLAKK